MRYENTQIVNILTSVIPRYSPIKNTTLYFFHQVQDGEKPEDVSYKYYKTTEYHWLILLLNNVVDPYYDWLLSARELQAYMENKYGSNLDSVHHFIDLRTNQETDQFDFVKYKEMLDNNIQLPYYISPISNSQHEIDRNEEKRSVKVVAPVYILDVVKQFEDEMNKNEY
jgi:hypothetical protein